VAEWSKAAAPRAVGPSGLAGSNPVPGAALGSSQCWFPVANMRPSVMEEMEPDRLGAKELKGST